MEIVGLPVDEAKKAVTLGDMVTMNRTLQEMGELLTCKCMDDRVAVYVMIEALKTVKEHNVEVHAIATVQEEIGLRGAAASGWSVKPDILGSLYFSGMSVFGITYGLAGSNGSVAITDTLYQPGGAPFMPLMASS